MLPALLGEYVQARNIGGLNTGTEKKNEQSEG